MSVHLRIEKTQEGVTATLSQRDDEGKVIGDPSVGLVAGPAEARQLAKALAQSLGLKVFRVIDKTKSASQPGKPSKTPEKPSETNGKTMPFDTGLAAATGEPPPWLVPGVGKSL
jgi:hypothetical protein